MNVGASVNAGGAGGGGGGGRLSSKGKLHGPVDLVVSHLYSKH